MRVSFPHFGHAVDFVVSMTFFRSAVFAIFAIHSLLTGMCRQPKSIARGSTWLLGVSFLNFQRSTTVVGPQTNAGPSQIRPNQPSRINPRRSRALYSPPESYTNCSRDVGLKSC